MSRNDNGVLQPLVSQLSEIHAESTQETTLTNLVPFQNLVPTETTSFYRYNGSLTTPACNQVVTWTVFDTPISMSENQARLFPKLFLKCRVQVINFMTKSDLFLCLTFCYTVVTVPETGGRRWWTTGEQFPPNPAAEFAHCHLQIVYWMRNLQSVAFYICATVESSLMESVLD